MTLGLISKGSFVERWGESHQHSEHHLFWDQNEMGAIRTVQIKSVVVEVVVEVVEKLHNFWLKDVPEVSVKRGSKTDDVRATSTV
jgi:hypothetical protein